jgi:hypothetical protein
MMCVRGPGRERVPVERHYRGRERHTPRRGAWRFTPDAGGREACEPSVPTHPRSTSCRRRMGYSGPYPMAGPPNVCGVERDAAAFDPSRNTEHVP